MKKLEDNLKNFISLLQDDINSHMGEEIPFMLTLDIKLGVQKENAEKMRAYEPKLHKLLSCVPTVIKPKEPLQ